MPAKEVIERLRAAGIEVKAQASAVDENQAKRAIAGQPIEAPEAKNGKAEESAAEAHRPARPSAQPVPGRWPAHRQPRRAARRAGPTRPALGRRRSARAVARARAHPARRPSARAALPAAPEAAQPPAVPTAATCAASARPATRAPVAGDASSSTPRHPVAAPVGPAAPAEAPRARRAVPPRGRGRRRRGTYDDTITPLDQGAQTRTDVVKVNSGSTVKDVAEYLGVPVPEIIKKLMGMGEMATLTQTLSDDAIGVIAEEFGKEVEIVHASEDVRGRARRSRTPTRTSSPARRS